MNVGTRPNNGMSVGLPAQTAYLQALQEEKRRQAEADRNQTIMNGGYYLDENAIRRMGAYNYGRDLGQKEFYNDPDMMALRKKREGMADGYDSSELSAIRDQGRGQIAGQRSNYLRQLSSNLAKGGVGGARAAAIKNQANQEGVKQASDFERKLASDSAAMKRQGVGDLQDFIFRQKLGATGLAYGQQSLAASDYAAQMGRQANSGGKK